MTKKWEVVVTVRKHVDLLLFIFLGEAKSNMSLSDVLLK